MKFTEQDIAKMCSSGNVFVNGRQYFENGRVKKLEKDEMSSDETYIYARVRGTHTYNVTVWLENGMVSHKLCDCAAFHKYPGICKHIAATLFCCLGKREAGAGDTVDTSIEMSRLIKEYTNRENAEALDMERVEKMTIVPHMSLGAGGEVKVDFKVGSSRKYVVKDVRKFVESVKNCEYYEYGKNFGFLHTPGAFDSWSEKLLRVIEGSVRENELFNKVYNKYAYMAALTVRELTLTPSALDLFVDLCMDRGIDFTEGGENFTAETVDANPDIRIQIEKCGEDGAMLTTMPLVLLRGLKRCYVLMNKKIYRCSEKYSEAMQGILTAAAAANGKALSIGRGDMVYFCNNVIPNISEFAVISTDGINLEQYSLPDASVKFFVDNPKRGVVTCKTECTYGDVRVDIFADSVGGREYRNRGMENNIKMCLMRYFEYNDSGVMELRDDDDALFRLADTGFDELRSFGEVYVSEQFERLRIAPAPKFSVGVSLSGGLLDFELNSDELSFKELSKILKSYKQRKKYHRLPDGSFLKLENNALAAVSEVVGNISDADVAEGDGNTITVPQYRALYIDSVLKGDIDMKRDANFKALIRSIKSVEDSDFVIPETLRSVLKNFQRKGFRWLKTLDSYGLSGILADEMGLGKTLQIISLFLSTKEEENDGCSLIVCPASLVYNWENEFAAFAPTVSVCVVAGALEERTRLIENYKNYDVLITSYDLLKRDIDLYKDVNFRFEVIDEAQYIKNYSTRSARSVKEIKARSRFALTGTPIENRLSELWSIFDFLMPGFLYDYRRFRNEFEIPVVKNRDETALSDMKRMIAPFILRRLKSDVLHELPEKLENVIISKMEAEQEKLYLAHVKQLKESLGKSRGEGLGRDAVKVLSELTRLRQICCDPSLVYENYSGGSAKLETCMNIVRETLENGHKVLIFSQFTSMLENFERRLCEEKIDFYTLTGATGKEKRMSLVTSFQTGKVPVFLISLKAGGTGLNLTAADVVIHYDPWWNVAAQNQATDRAHRIGQKHAVTVYKFIAKGSIEENILKLQDSKQNLAESIIADSGAYSGALTKDDILAILEGC